MEPSGILTFRDVDKTTRLSDLQKDYPVVSQEEVIKRNPEVIISFHPEKNIENRMGWGKIEAIRNSKVYKNIDQDCFLRPGPRLVEGFRELRRIIQAPISCDPF